MNMNLNRVLFAAIVYLVSSPSHSDQKSFGLGIGQLYNGLGMNVAYQSDAMLSYVALGCIGFAYQSNTSNSSNSDGTTRSSDEEYSSNCGVGLGVLSTRFVFDNGKHGLGLGLASTVNSTDDELDNQIEYHLRFTYNYFLNGVANRGLNLGIAPLITFDETGNEPGLLLNIGFQF